MTLRDDTFVAGTLIYLRDLRPTVSGSDRRERNVRCDLRKSLEGHGITNAVHAKAVSFTPIVVDSLVPYGTHFENNVNPDE